MTRATLLSLAFLPFVGALGSCEDLDVCDRGSCAAESEEASSGAGGRDDPSDAAGAAGFEDAGGAGGAEGGAEGLEKVAPLTCEPGLADCDNSRLTGCETHVALSVRHCGACQHSCDDGCLAGKCLDSLVVEVNATAEELVSTGSHAFARLVKLDGTSAFVRMRIDDGKLDELLPRIGSRVTLALGDRVYLLDEDDGSLLSLLPDGTDLKNERVTEPVAVGAYPDGTYYLDSIYDELSGTSTATLYFRADHGSAWEAIRKSESGRIESSSAYGVVYVEPDENDVQQLYLLRGKELLAYGPLPTNTSQVLATGDGLTVLTHDEEVPERGELWWLELEQEPVHYSLPTGYLPPVMRPYRDIVVISLADGHSAYVQRFDAQGAVLGPIGVRLGSELAAMDDRYLFHSVTDDWYHWRVVRTAWELIEF